MVVFPTARRRVICAMNEALWWVSAYVVALVVHELGHLIAARSTGIRVERAAIFFDANDWAWWRCRRGPTTYVVGWLPLGAYVRLAGMLDLGRKRLPGTIWGARLHQALLVLAAGTAANLLVAAVAAPLSPLCPFVLVNAGLGLLQLLPVPGTDGWQIVQHLRWWRRQV
jgi:membrane-associated protease RseP (regulator of RpoE activity)